MSKKWLGSDEISTCAEHKEKLCLLPLAVVQGFTETRLTYVTSVQGFKLRGTMWNQSRHNTTLIQYAQWLTHSLTHTGEIHNIFRVTKTSEVGAGLRLATIPLASHDKKFSLRPPQDTAQNMVQTLEAKRRSRFWNPSSRIWFIHWIK